MTTENVVSVFMVILFIGLFGGFIALWNWLMAGWFGSGLTPFFLAAFVITMFAVFGWLFVIVLVAAVALAATYLANNISG